MALLQQRQQQLVRVGPEAAAMVCPCVAVARWLLQRLHRSQLRQGQEEEEEELQVLLPQALRATL